MYRIEKAPETMSAKERVRRTFAFEKTDRVTIGYEANGAIHGRLKQALGAKDDEELRQALGVDYRGVEPRYTGPRLFAELPNRMVSPVDGCVMRLISHETGSYWDYCDFPLKDADDEAFARFPVPDPDDFDYDQAEEEVRFWGKQYAVHLGNPGYGDIINSSGMVMGTEDILCHLILGTPAVMDFIRRRAAWRLGLLERMFDRCRGMIDFLWLGEDLGTQIAPMISLPLYRERLKPIHKQFVDLAGAYDVPVLIHTCGSSSWVYEDFIEMGVKGVDTLQPEAANMSPDYLAGHFGGRLNFRGCISTAGPLAYGTAEEVRENCRRTLEILMPCRGYHFAPTHSIQDNSPTENVIAMYQAAHDLGRYR